MTDNTTAYENTVVQGARDGELSWLVLPLLRRYEQLLATARVQQGKDTGSLQSYSTPVQCDRWLTRRPDWGLVGDRIQHSLLAPMMASAISSEKSMERPATDNCVPSYAPPCLGATFLSPLLCRGDAVLPDSSTALLAS